MASNLLAAPAKDEQAEAEAILDNAIKAVGGEDKLAKLTSFIVKSRGKFHFNGVAGIATEEFSCDLPRRCRRHSIISEAEVLTIDCVVDGEQGWLSLNGKTSELSREEIAREKDDREESFCRTLAVYHLSLLKDKRCKLTPLGDAKIGDRQAVGIEVSREGRPDTQLYFDKNTGLPVKRSWIDKETARPKNPTPEPVKVAVLFDEYKEAGGVKYPAKVTMFRNDKEVSESVITEFKIVEKFDGEDVCQAEVSLRSLWRMANGTHCPHPSLFRNVTH